MPEDLQKLVYSTEKLRQRGDVDATWAPWWRAQARAIDAALREGVARSLWVEVAPGTFDRILKKDLDFADHIVQRELDGF